MPRPTAYLDTWKHGFIRVDKKGRKTFIIREMRAGRVFKVSTRCHTLEGALAAYEAWSKNPDAWSPAEKVVAPTSNVLEFTQELVNEFLEWSEKKGARGKGNSKEHVSDQTRALGWWLEVLGGTDLRALPLEEIHRQLRGEVDQVVRRKTLKTFYGWLRSEEAGSLLKLAEDPVFRMLQVPKRERAVANKAVAWADLLKIKAALTGHSKSVFTVQLATGWHVTELVRFGRSGRIDSYAGPQKGAAGVLVVVHKNGSEHRTAVDAETVTAAKAMLAYRPGVLTVDDVAEIKASDETSTVLGKKYGVSEAAIRRTKNNQVRPTGVFSGKIYSRAVQEVARKLKIDMPGAGQIRHSLATKLVNDGADIGVVSTFLGHRSLQTTKRFYATHSTPRNPALPGGLKSGLGQ